MNKNIVNSYIVRIYRGGKDEPHSVVGIVEDVGAEDKKAFTNYEELWEIMNPVTAGSEDLEKTTRHMAEGITGTGQEGDQCNS
ncbi:MAG: hypothetical protein OEU95_02250 [Nitrospirota bacterium]|nr:hypothetical protein [Nitrospirota bacterium]